MPMQIDFQIAIDLLVIAAYFCAVVFVGLVFGQKENSLESFALGGRSIPWWAVLASIIAAETSAATFLGTPGEGYKLVNYTYLQLVLGMIIGRIIVAFVFLRPFYERNVYSIYEYLQFRFGPGTRKAASAIFLVTRILASGARLYVAAIVLAVAFTLITGVQPSASQQFLIYLVSIVLITLITALYTAIGGIKAVIWTDCIQSSVMIGGAIGAIFVLLSQIPHAAVDQLLHSGKLSMITVGTDASASLLTNLGKILSADYTIWAALIGMTFTTLATHGTDQDMVQRMLTAPDYKKSRISLVLSGLADLPIGFIFLTIGILLNLYYQAHADAGLPTKTNEVFAYFILKQMPIGLRGLLIAGIFATAMGSLSAALNALATSYTRDFVQARAGHTEHTEDEVAVGDVRKFTYVFAGLVIVVAVATAYFVIAHPDSRIIPIVLGIFGYTYGSMLGIFLLGLLTKGRGTDTGNLIGMLVGFLVVAIYSGLASGTAEALGLKGVVALLAPVPVIGFPWRIMLGSLVTMACAAAFRSESKE
ncbi:MAG: sodium:proline symporter [Candidatus Melainabacteria bacterium]|nr:MAG: sodium:proline symporter [Candidatus Melainabacteria bacterium]